ncbi:hypothetical protein Trydic_g1836 [Trypoxylus dichotomus]
MPPPLLPPHGDVRDAAGDGSLMEAAKAPASSRSAAWCELGANGTPPKCFFSGRFVNSFVHCNILLEYLHNLSISAVHFPTTMRTATCLLRLTVILGLAVAEYIPPGPKYRCPKELLLLHPCKCESESDVGITVLCENTNLASMSVGLNNLATFKLPIERLTISKCHISRLYGSLLYKLILRTLYIKNTPIETIDEFTFLGVNDTLNELYILNTSLIEFPKAAFKILGEVTLLTIDGHNIPTLPPDAFADSDLGEKLTRFELSNGNLSVIEVGAVQPLRKLKMLDLHGNRLKELKRNQFRNLRELEILDLSHNALVKVDSGHIGDLIKLSRCNLSHNSIVEISRGAFARNGVLKVLNMSYNKIKKIDSTTFRGMRFLRWLFLSDNLIADVGRGTFASITRIGIIDLARNFIKKVDYQMFYQLTVIEKIDLSGNNITEISKLAFKDIYLTHINLSRNAISKIEDGAFENCPNITVLDLSYNKLRNIPKKAFDENTYTMELRLSYNLFTEMSQIPLHNMTGLKILDASYNEITNISKNTFPKLYELHTINFSHNNITTIFNSVFQVLFSLRSLDLSYNHLETIKPSTFGTIPTLLELDLSYNRLNNVAKSGLSRLASTRKLSLRNNKLDTLFILPISVSHLDLSYNEFAEIPPKLWPSMNSLLHLDLSHNKIGDNMVKGSFLGLLTLQALNLNYNGVTKPPWEALSDFPALQYLYLEGNNLTKLEKSAFGRLPVVFELNLAFNQIGNVTEKAFDGLLQMLKLNLTNNNLTHIPNGAFQGLVALKSLDLSHNRLDKLDNKTHGLLDELLSLEYIDLSHNRISFITRKTFPSNPYIPYKLGEINLSYNHMPVLTYDIVSGTSKVQKLNLSNCGITEVRRYVIGNLTRLRILDMSNNKIESLDEEYVFKLPENVSELYFSDNVLKDLPWDEFKNVSDLKVLDLRYNNFESIGGPLNEMIVKDVDVYLEGNPISCDCFVRPFKRYLSGQLKIKEIYKTVKCTNPSHLHNRAIPSISEDRLNCPTNVNTTRLMRSQPGDYDITPDLAFREFRVKEKKLKMKWRVLKNDDIADTYVVIRNIKNPSLYIYETTLPYTQRSFELNNTLTTKLQATGRKYHVCIIALDSKTSVKSLYPPQCRDITQSSSKHIASGILLTITAVVVAILL